LGVEYFDPFRYKLIDERSLSSAGKIKSKTKETTVYHIKNEWLVKGRF
jgi:hypothetical protein